MKRADVHALLAERDRSAADTLAALQRLDDTTTGGITVRRLLDGLAALHGPASETVAPLVWRKGEAVPAWLDNGAQVRILACSVSDREHSTLLGEFLYVGWDGDARVALPSGAADARCTGATALELVAPVPAAADPDVDAAEWKRRALDAERRISAAAALCGGPCANAACSDKSCRVARALRGDS